METNLIIKSFKTDGDEIKDIEFYGDVELDTSNGSDGFEVEYKPVSSIALDTLPYGVSVVVGDVEYDETYNNWTFKFRNAGPCNYLISIEKTLMGLVKPGQALTLPKKHEKGTLATMGYFVEFYSEDGSKLVGMFKTYDQTE